LWVSRVCPCCQRPRSSRCVCQSLTQTSFPNPCAGVVSVSSCCLLVLSVSVSRMILIIFLAYISLTFIIVFQPCVYVCICRWLPMRCMSFRPSVVFTSRHAQLSLRLFSFHLTFLRFGHRTDSAFLSRPILIDAD